MNIESARNPKRTVTGDIDLLVKFSHLPVEVLFTASNNDDVGRKIFQDAEAGLYGPVEPYVESEQ
jgi:hypothetical protein